MSLGVGLSTLVTIECLLLCKTISLCPIRQHWGNKVTSNQNVPTHLLWLPTLPAYFKILRKGANGAQPRSAGGCVGVKPQIPPPTSSHLQTNRILSQ